MSRGLDGRNVTLSYGDEKVAEEFKRYEDTFGEEKTSQLRNEFKEFLLKARNWNIKSRLTSIQIF
jgi:hypothetical protein